MNDAKFDWTYTGLLTLLAVFLLAPMSGCKTFTVKPGADPLVVYAEASTETALDVFDAFLKWERNNEAALLKVNPAIHSTANEIRVSGPKWIDELKKATRTYKTNRTEANKTALLMAQQLLDFAIAEARARCVDGGKSL